MPADSTKHPAAALLACATQQGFAGGLFWAFNDPSHPLGAGVAALKAFSAAHPADSYAALVAWLRGHRAPRAIDTSTPGAALAVEPAAAVAPLPVALLPSPQDYKRASEEAFLRALQPVEQRAVA